MSSPDLRKVYIGSTTNLFNRAIQHRNKVYDGYSKINNCTRLVFYEMYPSILEAFARERTLKGWNRKKKNNLIELVNPQWIDLGQWDNNDLLEIISPPIDLDTRI